MNLILIGGDSRGEWELAEVFARVARADGERVLIVRSERAAAPALNLILDEAALVERVLAATSRPMVQFPKRRVIPAISWWDANDSAPDDAPPAVDVPREAFRPLHRPSLSGKRTRYSQKLHNRRAA